MAGDVALRRVHRIIAVLFLLSIPPAGYYSFTGDPASPSPVVYIPLLPLLGLTLTGSYLLVMTWVRGRRARRTLQGHAASQGQTA